MYIWLVRINKINFEVAKSAASYCQISHVPRVCDALITLHTSNRLRTTRGRLTIFSFGFGGGGSDS